MNPADNTDTFNSLQSQDVRILVVAVGNFDETDTFFTSTDFFVATDFSDLSNLIEAIVCDDSISLFINEVMIVSNNIHFIELYNNGVGVSLTGFKFVGLFNYTITEADNAGIAQNSYWVISDVDMNAIDQTDCRNCSQDLLISSSYTGWTVRFYNAIDELIDEVVYNSVYFPSVDYYFTFQLINEPSVDSYYDLNNNGGYWKESCYEYGTPQEINVEDCPCNAQKCRGKGDNSAYCGG